jgi:glyoxylase-like metal-dependent hydrolase (beta-lactamase superfamily II)
MPELWPGIRPAKPDCLRVVGLPDGRAVAANDARAFLSGPTEPTMPMRHAVAVPFLIAGLATSAVAAQQPATRQSRDLEVVGIAEGVFAALQPADRRFDDGNAAFVVLENGVLVVDTHNSPVRASQVIAAIRDRTDLPVRWVVNTHWHGDHVQGNQAYREAWPDVAFIAHEATSRDISARAIPALAEEKEAVPGWIERAKEAAASGVADGQTLTQAQLEDLRARIERREEHWAAIREVGGFVVPDRTFTDTLTIGGEARLIHHRGHTEGDVVVWLPARRVLITGDLLDDLPYTGHGSPAALVRTLHAFAAYDFDAIVPGHGRVRRGREHLRSVTALFESIVAQATAARESGLDADAAVERTDLSPFRDTFVNDSASERYWNFFMAEAVRRAWEEAANTTRTPRVNHSASAT